MQPILLPLATQHTSAWTCLRMWAGMNETQGHIASLKMGQKMYTWTYSCETHHNRVSYETCTRILFFIK